MDERTNNIESKNPEVDICVIFNYFNEHPIMLLGVGISFFSLAICKLLDDKYNKGGNHE